MSALSRRHSDFRHDPAPSHSSRADQRGSWARPLVAAIAVGWLALIGLWTVLGWIWNWAVG